MRPTTLAAIADSTTNSPWARRVLLSVAVLLTLASEPVLAQSAGRAFCETELVATIKNIFAIVQFGGPLIGGVIAVGATVALPVVRRTDRKQELKEMRNQALLWGVIVAPLATVLLQFLLNNVVVGGTSCGF